MPNKKRKFSARFPPARIKKIMQKDEEVGKVAVAVPVIISRALEMFIESLIVKSAETTKSRNAKTLSSSHIKQTILSEKKFDFLKDLVASIPDVQGEDDSGEGSVLPPKPAPKRASASASKPPTEPTPGKRPRGRPRKVKGADDVAPPKPEKRRRQEEVESSDGDDDSDVEETESGEDESDKDEEMNTSNNTPTTLSAQEAVQSHPGGSQHPGSSIQAIMTPQPHLHDTSPSLQFNTNASTNPETSSVSTDERCLESSTLNAQNVVHAQSEGQQNSPSKMHIAHFTNAKGIESFSITDEDPETLRETRPLSYDTMKVDPDLKPVIDKSDQANSFQFEQKPKDIKTGQEALSVKEKLFHKIKSSTHDATDSDSKNAMTSMIKQMENVKPGSNNALNQQVSGDRATVSSLPAPPALIPTSAMQAQEQPSHAETNIKGLGFYKSDTTPRYAPPPPLVSRESTSTHQTNAPNQVIPEGKQQYSPSKQIQDSLRPPSEKRSSDNSIDSDRKTVSTIRQYDCLPNSTHLQARSSHSYNIAQKPPFSSYPQSRTGSFDTEQYRQQMELQHKNDIERDTKNPMAHERSPSQTVQQHATRNTPEYEQRNKVQPSHDDRIIAQSRTSPSMPPLVERANSQQISPVLDPSQRSKSQNIHQQRSPLVDPNQRTNQQQPSPHFEPNNHHMQRDQQHRSPHLDPNHRLDQQQLQQKLSPHSDPNQRQRHPELQYQHQVSPHANPNQGVRQPDQQYQHPVSPHAEPNQRTRPQPQFQQQVSPHANTNQRLKQPEQQYQQQVSPRANRNQRPKPPEQQYQQQISPHADRNQRPKQPEQQYQQQVSPHADPNQPSRQAEPHYQQQIGPHANANQHIRPHQHYQQQLSPHLDPGQRMNHSQQQTSPHLDPNHIMRQVQKTDPRIVPGQPREQQSPCTIQGMTSPQTRGASTGQIMTSPPLSTAHSPFKVSDADQLQAMSRNNPVSAAPHVQGTTQSSIATPPSAIYPRYRMGYPTQYGAPPVVNDPTNASRYMHEQSSKQIDKQIDQRENPRFQRRMSDHEKVLDLSASTKPKSQPEVKSSQGMHQMSQPNSAHFIERTDKPSQSDYNHKKFAQANRDAESERARSSGNIDFTPPSHQKHGQLPTSTQEQQMAALAAAGHMQHLQAAGIAASYNHQMAAAAAAAAASLAPPARAMGYPGMVMPGYPGMPSMAPHLGAMIPGAYHGAPGYWPYTGVPGMPPQITRPREHTNGAPPQRQERGNKK